jgi:hypothetical protein
MGIINKVVKAAGKVTSPKPKKNAKTAKTKAHEKTTQAHAISMNILVDSSGSMHPIANDMAGALNQLVDENRELDVLVTYSVFSNDYRPVFADRPIRAVENFSLIANGNTALIESACKMIDEVGARLAAMQEKDRPEKVMFVLVTDGEENASAPEYTKERLLAKIREQTDVYNWLFLYLGANQDAITVAQSYGIAPDKALGWKADKRGTDRNAARLSKKLKEVGVPGVCMQNVAWDAEDRED